MRCACGLARLTSCGPFGRRYRASTVPRSSGRNRCNGTTSSGRLQMGDIKWYKRDPRAALTGMMPLTLEERGAYNTVLDLIYCYDGAIPDDDYFVAGWLRVSRRIWRRIRLSLIEKHKIYVHGGKIRNERADFVVS